ncbi:MAG: NTP transferase domain-containing protein [Nitrososphaerota archaeon]|jgi:adenosylcobinamide-phosphate guanylyltransferase|nr:NTP transferase domain-containing protein [Nitrososphaerota archaeon]
MTVSALVMAGGRGSRMNSSVEKPLVDVCGKPVIAYVLDALLCAELVDDVYVAVTERTPCTVRYVEGLRLKSVVTPGKDYVSDMGFAAQVLGLGKFLAIAADLPLVTGGIVDVIVSRYECCGKPALTVAVPVETKKHFGMSVDYSFKMGASDVVPTGINVIDGAKRYGDELLDQDIFLLDKVELAVNVNTPQELQIAKNLLLANRQKNV